MRRFLFIISILFFAKLAHSQDIITLKNGDKLKVKVLQVDDYKVTYKKPEDADGKFYTIELSKIFIIIFEKKNEKYLQNRKNSVDTSGKK